jgi:hypothetical protein
LILVVTSSLVAAGVILNFQGLKIDWRSNNGEFTTWMLEGGGQNYAGGLVNFSVRLDEEHVTAFVI